VEVATKTRFKEEATMRYGKTMTTITILTALLAAAPLTAGAQSKMEEAKDKAKGMTRDAKTAVSDTWITSKTKIALYADERVKGTQISVDTMKGGVVHLRGKVDSAEAKSAAGDIAKGIEGVQSVKNDLQVVAPSSRKMVDAKDEDITKAVETRFSRDAQLKKVDVRIDAGVATLTGEVPSITVAAKASEMARNTPGVKSVKNELTVRQAGK
jgi:hyperosmotically inducible protein